MIRNPFVTNGYVEAEYFCDRVQETDFMVRMLNNQNNIALISPSIFTRKAIHLSGTRKCFRK